MTVKRGNKTYNIPDVEIEKLKTALDITTAEAIGCWLDDNDIEEDEEAAALNEKASKVKIDHGASAEEKKPRKPKERKVDEEKGQLLTEIEGLLKGLGATDTQMKTETEVSFNFNGNAYTVKLTKHRKK